MPNLGGHGMILKLLKATEAARTVAKALAENGDFGGEKRWNEIADEIERLDGQ
jgi:hypothetical protein